SCGRIYVPPARHGLGTVRRGSAARHDGDFSPLHPWSRPGQRTELLPHGQHAQLGLAGDQRVRDAALVRLARVGRLPFVSPGGRPVDRGRRPQRARHLLCRGRRTNPSRQTVRAAPSIPAPFPSSYTPIFRPPRPFARR
ncbi:unnamed protein product, partial [Hapterophycus canaliculatus]